LNSIPGQNTYFRFNLSGYLIKWKPFYYSDNEFGGKIGLKAIMPLEAK